MFPTVKSCSVKEPSTLKGTKENCTLARGAGTDMDVPPKLDPLETLFETLKTLSTERGTKSSHTGKTELRCNRSPPTDAPNKSCEKGADVKSTTAGSGKEDHSVKPDVYTNEPKSGDHTHKTNVVE